MKDQIKKYAVLGLVGLNIFALGAVFGAYQWSKYETSQNQKVQNAINQALKSIPQAQAASK